MKAPGASRPSRNAPRIFYKLERNCPEHYYPKLHTTSSSIRTLRSALLVLCVVQLLVALSILYATAITQYLHDPFHERFTEGVAALCAFAACAGFVGVCVSSRPMLLLLYINQLWSLSNVSTFAVIYLTTADQSATACTLFRRGELTVKQVSVLPAHTPFFFFPAARVGTNPSASHTHSHTRLYAAVPYDGPPPPPPRLRGLAHAPSRARADCRHGP